MGHVDQVVLVGHCGFDSPRLAEAARRALGVPVVSANDSRELDRLLAVDSLLLVNRQLDGGFDSSGGVDLIRELAGRPRPPVMMLISNYPESQAEAVKAGAVQGFGKSQLDQPMTLALLRQAASRGPSAAAT